MMRVLVTGAAGQVGAELRRAQWPDGTVLHALARDELDICAAHSVDAVVDRIKPHVIVNAAAYTAVDHAEDEPELAKSVNTTAVGNLATAADRHDALLIHISTDYVFDGTKAGWYVESDPVAPLGVYGSTKAAGEREARRCRRHLILRTAWVYGALGPNFVRTMLRLGDERPELTVVADQRGCPTAAGDIATAIVTAVKRIGRGPAAATYHLCSPEDATWHEFASEIVARAGSPATVRPITTAEYPTRATRPANSRLDSSAIGRDLSIALPPWRTSLTHVLAELGRGTTEKART